MKEDFGSIDILVHSLANGPEVGFCLIKSLQWYTWKRLLYKITLHRSANPYLKLLEMDILQQSLHRVTHLFLCWNTLLQSSTQVPFVSTSIILLKCVQLCWIIFLRFFWNFLLWHVHSLGGATISLTYIASEKIIPGYAQVLLFKIAFPALCIQIRDLLNVIYLHIGTVEVWVQQKLLSRVTHV